MIGIETLAVRYTQGGEGTQPGGIIIRRKVGGEFIVHHFSRKAGSLEPRGFFWGHYGYDEADAWESFAEKIRRTSKYDGVGGGLIQPAAITDHGM
jgi:hypothetical protein